MDVGRKNDVPRKLKDFGSTEYDIAVGTPGRDMFKIGVQRYPGDTTATFDVGVHMAKSVVGKRTMKSGVIGKILDWIGSSGQKTINE